MSTTPAPTVTEAEVLAFVNFHGERIAALYPNLKGVYLSASSSGNDFLICGYTESFKGVMGSASTVEKAEALFISEAPTPAKEAADLRARAAELLATADRLSAAQSGTTTLSP